MQMVNTLRIVDNKALYTSTHNCPGRQPTTAVIQKTITLKTTRLTVLENVDKLAKLTE